MLYLQTINEMLWTYFDKKSNDRPDVTSTRRGGVKERVRSIISVCHQPILLKKLPILTNITKKLPISTNITKKLPISTNIIRNYPCFHYYHHKVTLVAGEYHGDEWEVSFSHIFNLLKKYFFIFRDNNDWLNSWLL